MIEFIVLTILVASIGYVTYMYSRIDKDRQKSRQAFRNHINRMTKSVNERYER